MKVTEPVPLDMERFWLHSLLFYIPGWMSNPGATFTLDKFDLGDIREVIENAEPKVRDAYLRMHHPPEFELYDLKNDPCEWNNLTTDPSYRETPDLLKSTLHDWQVSTKDPLVDKKLAERLFDQIVETNKEKANIPYAEYLDSGLFQQN